MQEIGFRTALACPDQKLWEGKARLRDDGVLLGSGGIGTWGAPQAIGAIKAADYAGLVLPGGGVAVEVLKQNEQVAKVVKEFLAEGLPVAAIGEGLELVRAFGLADARELASKERPVVEDKGLVTAWDTDNLSGFWRQLERVLRAP